MDAVSTLLKCLKSKRYISDIEKAKAEVSTERITLRKEDDLFIRDAITGYGTILKEDLDHHYYITTIKMGTFGNTLSHAIILREGPEADVEGILTIAEEKGRYKLYNLGSGQGVSIRELIDTIAEVLHKTPCIRYEAGRKVDVPVNVLDIVRYEQDFGHRNNIPLREGIQKLAAFFEQN